MAAVSFEIRVVKSAAAVEVQRAVVQLSPRAVMTVVARTAVERTAVAGTVAT